jgi:hypothetical protein
VVLRRKVGGSTFPTAFGHSSLSSEPVIHCCFVQLGCESGDSTITEPELDAYFVEPQVSETPFLRRSNPKLPQMMVKMLVH